MDETESIKLSDNVYARSDNEEARTNYLRDFKSELNNLLFPFVPNGMTIAEFEDLACSINDQVERVWQKYL